MCHQPTTARTTLHAAIQQAARAYYSAYLDWDPETAIERLMDATADTDLAEQLDDYDSPAWHATIEGINAAADAYRATRIAVLKAGGTRETADEAAGNDAIDAYHRRLAVLREP